ncbi:MAG TPA: RbsD/FucU domain-containing protein [Rubrobacteraceae bacterium]|nr:RbsD/FucU domain-containing protein [Rubrobacteraceae bacterium]
MKRGGILNARLSAALARLGHTDLVVACDAGLTIPFVPEVHDLLREGLLDPALAPREKLKRMVAGTKLVVRAGGATPYSNVILRCGVPF